MLTIDGSQKEGGGQILRTALALSLVTGAAFRIHRIRAKRSTPGLQRQHLTAVDAAAAVSGAAVTGHRIGSGELTFAPGAIKPGDYAFAVGTAGSTTLVLQTVLPALLRAAAGSRLTLDGGTHNLAAPPYDFLAHAFVPVLRTMGADVSVRLERIGFYPGGGGRLRVEIGPASSFAPLSLTSRGALRRRRARALVSHLPRHIAERELAVLRRELALGEEELAVEEVEAFGPGNVLMVEIQSDAVTEVFTAFGERGVRAETVARRAVQQVTRYLDAGVPVGEHLADQLLVPMAVMKGGAFATLPLSLHAETNIDVIRQFLAIPVDISDRDRNVVTIDLSV